MIWIGILIGIVAMMLTHYVVNFFLDFAGRKRGKIMVDLMIEGNKLRYERNQILDRIADKGEK